MTPLKISLLALGLLATPAAFATSAAFVTTCVGQDNQCTDTKLQKDFALSAARQYATRTNQPGTYKVVIQSDANDSVNVYDFQLYQDYHIVEGFDGGDMSNPYTAVRLTRQYPANYSLSQAVNKFVSPKYATKHFANKHNLPTNNNGALDLVDFCEVSHTEVNPSTMLQRCEKALWANKYWQETYLTKSEQNELLGQLGLTQTINATVGIIESTLEGMLNLGIKRSENITKSFGGPLRFERFDGTVVLTKPTLDGSIEYIRFTIPPENDIPVSKEGFIDFEKLNKLAEEGTYSWTHASAPYVHSIANRTGMMRWRRLAIMIDEGFECTSCRVTITEPPIQK
ncbi:hypothetical protein [Psychrobium sp. 1_MG-2023]|uniref:hypothetical protein n=1 Tax=Psychrobium sp. 1_MG-2023 TaxID=3062624 RepID=UPI000C32003D|nr:hypothetical protein [Psychrobium sp. 1_MG-2023]MDP2560243.1 hypothetical protein [Psychrobium sp. 1_MG-2023]PKF57053.1 hypothetical protein CW748_08120 [Alteromonadales bacterium alter-6D02]